MAPGTLPNRSKSPWSRAGGQVTRPTCTRHHCSISNIKFEVRRYGLWGTAPRVPLWFSAPMSLACTIRPSRRDPEDGTKLYQACHLFCRLLCFVPDVSGHGPRLSPASVSTASTRTSLTDRPYCCRTSQYLFTQRHHEVPFHSICLHGSAHLGSPGSGC